jgi:hypothetical protein
MGGVMKASIMVVSVLTMGVGHSLQAQGTFRPPSTIPFTKDVVHQSQADTPSLR